LAKAPDKSNRPLKTGFYSVFYTIVSNGAIVLCFIPFLFLFWKNMRMVRTWWVLGIYWLLNGLDNLMEIWFATRTEGSHALVRQLSVCYSLVETPLLLLTFALARQGRSRKGLLLVLVLFMVGESILLRLRGNGYLGLIVGSGLGIIILYSLMGLLDYVKNMEHTRFENSMVYIYAALLFSYGSTLIIYIFTHYHGAVGTNSHDMDSFLLYYVSLLLSAAITCAGLWSYGIRRSRPRPWSASSGYSSSSS
jgi:hypothetical protein